MGSHLHLQENDYNGGHRCGHRCKSGIKNQYLNDGYGIGNHGAYNSVYRNGKDQHRCKQDDSTDHNHNEDHGYKYGHPSQPSTRCESRQNSQHYSSNIIQKKKENCTPSRERRPRPRVNLFQHPEEEVADTEVVPVETDLEVLLINSWKINVTKVQTIVEEFIRDKNYTTIFCLTETKVEGHDFQPEGIRIISKQRKRKTEGYGGGLALGYIEEANVELEEIKVKSSDILAVEGKINNNKFRIVLCYFGSKKLVKGTEYLKNRNLQKQVEKQMEVDPGTSLLVLGDFNGRLAKLEKGKKTDPNGQMIEEWVEKYSMHHLNALDTCDGTYTFTSLNGKSAIDHMLTNGTLFEKHLSMVIDEDRTMLNISDHNLVRAWFQLGNDNYMVPKKKPVRTVTWISREQDRIDLCVSDFKTKIGKKMSFKGCMGKIKTSVEHAMRRKMKRKPGGKKKLTLKAAPWVDGELISNIKLRSKYSREWGHARKRGEPEEVVERYRRSYMDQKSRTAIMTENKKSLWESKKIEETWKDSKAFWKMIAELLGKNKNNTEEAFIFQKALL